VFAPETDSTFLLDCTDKELSDAGGLQFVVKDWDLIGTNDELGSVRIDPQTLKSGNNNGDAMEMKVTPPKKKEEEDAGHLLIRWRNATADDLKTIQSKKKIHTNMFPTTTKDAAAAAWSSSPENNKTEEHKPADPISSSSDNKDKSMDPPEMVAEAQVGGTKEEPTLGEQLHLKLEIVSCRGLLIADKTSSDPYVKIMSGEKDLHKTKHIVKT